MNEQMFEKLPTSAMFQPMLAIATLGYAHAVLVYMLRRPDLALTAAQVEPLLRRSRSVKSEYLDRFYENLSPLTRALIRYAGLEESVTKSGAYEKDRVSALDSVIRCIRELEDKENADVMRMLRGMCGL